jgi:hypothetical protein
MYAPAHANQLNDIRLGGAVFLACPVFFAVTHHAPRMLAHWYPTFEPHTEPLLP